MYAGIRVFVFEVSSQILLGLKVALVAGITTARPRGIVIRPMLELDMLEQGFHAINSDSACAALE